ncbi:MAG: sulfotransferase family 2 domain-containing protein [Actinomycetes bacterium]
MTLGERRLFALRHLYVYPRIKIAYTYIPKNACSSFKQTFGEAQGWLTEARGSQHDMTVSWWMSGLRSYRQAEERIVVLRDPWDRLVSGFQNRFLLRDDPVAAHALSHGLAALLGPGKTTDDVTFSDFVHYLASTPNRRLNEHWRPQADFLVGDYTRVIHFETLKRDTRFLRNRDLPLKRMKGHATSTLRTDLGPGWGHRTVAELRALRAEQRVLPSRASMFDDELEELVGRRYAADVSLVSQ